MASSQESPPEVLDMREASAWLKISERTLADLVANGEVPSFRVGKQHRFALAELRRWASETSQIAQATAADAQRKEVSR